MKQPEFGKKIAERRIELGFTQEELAEKCKIIVRSIQRIETGKVNPRSYTLKMLDHVLELKKGIDYKEKVKNLKEFYEHLALYFIINFFIYLNDLLDPTKDFVPHKISIIWGIFVLIHAAEVFFEIFFGAAWEEKKIKKLMDKINVFSSIRNILLSKPAFPKSISKIILPGTIGVSIFWYLFIGYHNHQVIINRGNISINIKSADSRFEFSTSEKRARAMNEYAINEYKMTSEFGKPFKINGHGIIISKQIINLPDSISEYKFAVNDLDFTLIENNLFHQRNNWYLQPNDPLTINADKINQSL